MRLKFGRPALDPYRHLFDLEPARDGDLAVTFLGVSTLLVNDGEHALMTDGFFSRPGLFDVAARKVSPNHARIRQALNRTGKTALDAVMPVHSHYDHVMDSAVVADITGAALVGGESTANVGRGHGLPTDQITVVGDGTTTTYGSFTVTHVVSNHCPPDRYPGTIDKPLRPPARVKDYRCGEAWSIHVRHEPTGRTALIQGSAGFVEGATAGLEADVVYLGIGQLGIHDRKYIETYWYEHVTQTGAKLAVMTHWDDFFRGLDEPLRALPMAGDDLDNTMHHVTRLAERDGVRVAFPTLWQAENPWA